MYLPGWLIIVLLYLCWRHWRTHHRTEQPDPCAAYVAREKAAAAAWLDEYKAQLKADLAQQSAAWDQELAAYSAELQAWEDTMYDESNYWRGSIGAPMLSRPPRRLTPRTSEVASIQVAAAPRDVTPPAPTVWGPDKPWKTEAQYRNALQVAQWDKAQRQAAQAD